MEFEIVSEKINVNQGSRLRSWTLIRELRNVRKQEINAKRTESKERILINVIDPRSFAYVNKGLEWRIQILGRTRMHSPFRSSLQIFLNERFPELSIRKSLLQVQNSSDNPKRNENEIRF